MVRVYVPQDPSLIAPCYRLSRLDPVPMHHLCCPLLEHRFVVYQIAPLVVEIVLHVLTFFWYMELVSDKVGRFQI